MSVIKSIHSILLTHLQSLFVPFAHLVLFVLSVEILVLFVFSVITSCVAFLMMFYFHLSALNKYFNLSPCLLVCSDYYSDLNCVYVHFLRDFCLGMPQFMF